MSLHAKLPPGATVSAAVDFGPVIRGQPGMVTGQTPGGWLPWRRATYFCTFLGCINVVATRRQIVPYDHGCSLRMLKDPLWFLHTRDAVASSNRGEPANLRRQSR